MFSINTNNSAMTALESLQMTATALSQTEKAVSTGLKVGSSSDDPAIYAIAQRMDGNIAGLTAVSSSLSFGAEALGTASSASQNIISTLTTLQQSVTYAGTTGISTATIQTNVANALNQINNFARNSTFNGVNLLTSSADGAGVTSGTLSVVVGVTGNTFNVSNQASGLAPGSVTLTDALGLTSNMAAGDSVIANGAAGAGQVTQNILTNAGTGVNISTSSTLAAASFANGDSVVLTNGDGSRTTFEFDASGQAATTADTTGANANHTVVVNVDKANESTNQMMGDLVQAMNQNGYNAVIQQDGSINVTGKGLTQSTSSVTGINAGTSLSSATSAITTIQAAITKMTDVVSVALGATTQQITGMQTFTSDLSDALTSGVGALTDADLSAESAKLTSLQTKQQLAIQSLSIANSQSQSILSLFR